MKQTGLEHLTWLSKLNSTDKEYPKDNLVQLFEKKVVEHPDNIACIFQDNPITYSELNKRANQLAHFLQRQEITPHSAIAVYLERSIELVISFLAVMKLGRPYIPIDKEASSIQITNILDDANVNLILTGEVLTEAIAPSTKNRKIIIINQNNNETLQEKDTNLPPFSVKELAYILYTSGTTGKPKGVQISHKSLVNLLFAMAEEIDITEKDVLLGITPFTFDLSVPDIYLPLITGGKMILGGQMARFNPHEIIRYIAQHQVTWMQATPTTWQMLVTCGWKNESNIKIITGGEALTNQLANKLTLLSNHVWNFYGPTETTVWSTCHKIGNIDKNKPHIPIGKPLPNTQIYILDDDLNPLSVDEPGELYIGGDGVSQGYVNNNELNLNYFIDNPFSATPEQKLYRTGDLAKWTTEDELYYLGRIDTQIKLRGYRIEVEAIENVLLDYPGIHECIVHNQTPDNKTELVAYVTLKTKTISASKIQEYLKNHFPDYMIPTKYIVVNQFPLTFNGKINRTAIPSITEYTNIADEIGSSPLQNPIEEVIVELIKSLLNRDVINPESNFFNLGLHSLLLVELADKLNKTLNQTMSVVDLFTYPTVRSLAQFLTPLDAVPEGDNINLSSEKNLEHCIAVIGMACKLPGANNPNDFWQTILNKTEAISFFNERELLHAGINPDLINNPDYIPARGIIHNVDQFDAAFFGYTPSEARMTDPQHRVFLENAWAALEDAGYIAEKFPGNVGLFAGMSDSTYLTQNILYNTTGYADYDQQQLMLATSSHYLCTKVAYAMGLKGPAVTVNTACSTSLVAIAMACDSLKSHQCDMALAGGITITVPEQSGYLYRELGILSPNGHCRVFDKESKGTVMSNGCGIVVLKRLSDALKENDNILAVIKGWAINNDGEHKAGFTAPSVLGQIACIQEAKAKAQINTEDMGYIEAHGTGTALGDPIEITALSKGYGYEHHKKNNYCALGSVKANIGHTDVASGVAGFIKLVMALQKRTLPPQIHFASINEKINLTQSPFYVNCDAKPWESKKRLGAVHSLGFGGTNAHVILEEAPSVKTTESKSSNVFLLSAKTPYSLDAIRTELQNHLASQLTDSDRAKTLADIAYTLQIGRKHFQHRMAVVYSGYDDLLKRLSQHHNKPVVSNNADTSNGRIIFGFSGQGTQYASMASDLYKNNPLFKHVVDDCCEKIQDSFPFDLRTLLFPKPQRIKKANEMLSNTLYAQPTLFIIEYALAQLLIEFGIKPNAMIGHSLGELVAATIAGVFSLETSLKIIATRARLMAKTKPGAMLVVPLSREILSSYLNRDLDLAAHNAPNLCVVSGSKEHLIELEKTLHPLLDKEGLGCKYLRTSHAFHSAAMEEVCDEFAEVIREMTINPPSIPYISNVSGTWIQKNDLHTPQYWANHLRQPVLFSEGVLNLKLSSEDVFIEIGPGSTLTQLVKQHQNQGKTPQLITTLPNATQCEANSYQSFLNTIGTLWLLKKEIHWERLYANEIRKRASLPTYVFERQSHWIHPAQNTAGENKSDTQGLYTPSWKKDRTHILNRPKEKSCKTWLIFSKSTDNFLENDIKEAGHFIYRIYAGDSFKQLTPNSFVIDPTQKSHYEQLLKSIELHGDQFIILHAWLFDNAGITDDTETMLHNGPYSLLYLSQLLSEIHPQIPVNFLVLTCNLYSVLGNECILPVKTSLLGPCKVIPLEQETVFCKAIDLNQDEKISPHLETCLFREALFITRDCAKNEIAYRGGQRWVRILEPCTDYLEASQKPRIKSKGVYLITGGLGGIGLSLAKYLAEHYQANIILVSRTSIPPQQEWDAYINQNDPQSKMVQKLKSLERIKQVAENLTVEQACIENESQMRRIIRSIQKRFGTINGVIHAAGVAGGGVAQFKTLAEYNRVLLPKLQGTQTLLKLLHDAPLDFMVFVSSLTSILGYPGQTDYCSANRILDAYANSSPFKHSVFCVAMNWQAWRDVGMAVESNTKLFQLDETNSNTPAEGVVIFEKILNSDLNQVIISNSDPNTLHISKDPMLITNKESPQLIENNWDNDTVTPVVLNIWRNVLGITNIQLDDDFYELGGHSLLAITLLAKLKKRFKIKIPTSVLFEAKTVRSLSEVIQSYTQQEQSPLVVLRQGPSNKPPVFIVHPIGGTVFCYLPLVETLKNDRTYYGLQDPGLELEKPFFHSIEEMATFYRKAIQKIQPKGPYYLCGASFGATVVTEIAYQLLELKEKIHFVGLIDGWASFSNAQLDANYVETLKTHHQENPSVAIIPQGVENPQLWEKMLRHRLNMMMSYSIKKIDIRLSLFKAREILLEYKEINAEDNHWSSCSTLPINCYTVPGNHNSMLQKPHVNVLAKQILKHLD